MTMARFDVFVNPNKKARHALYVDVQSDFVQLPTRWCIPLYQRAPSIPISQGAQAVVRVDHQEFVMDTPNMLPVPTILLRQKSGRLVADDQLVAESCIEFILRGY
jgi:hypothetical protein